MVKFEYLNSEKQKYQHLIEDDEMSQMALIGAFYISKCCCGLQNDEREKIVKKLRKYSIYLVL